MTREEKLLELFNAAVEKYRVSELCVIGEFSGHIQDDEEKLYAEASAMIAEFKEALQERPKGRWNRSSVFVECQICGEVYDTDGGNGGKAWNFCPNCGADMRGEEE